MEVRNTTDRMNTEGDELFRNRDTDAATIRPAGNLIGEGDEDFDDEDEETDDADLLDDDVEEVAVADDAAVPDLDDADLAAEDLDEDIDLDDEDDEEDDDL